MKNERSAAVMAGLLCLAAVVHADSSGIGFGPGQSMSVSDVLRAAGTSQVPRSARIIQVGYVAGDDPSAGKPSQAVEWVSINGGKFKMGTDDGADLFRDAKPIREVAIETFEMSKTLVTVEQYAECVIKGGCTEPDTGRYCNGGKPDRRRHPINCVTWGQAGQFARFKGARLPTEAEWEYAAASGGKNQKYPWGNEAATCERAVMKGGDGNGGYGYGCGSGGTMRVCAKPAGNAKFASGGELCDAVGNVSQWVQDEYRSSYVDAPIDGSAVEGAGSHRVIRGGSFDSGNADYLRADLRFGAVPGNHYGDVGFRLAR